MATLNLARGERRAGQSTAGAEPTAATAKEGLKRLWVADGQAQGRMCLMDAKAMSRSGLFGAGRRVIH